MKNLRIILWSRNWMANGARIKVLIELLLEPKKCGLAMQLMSVIQGIRKWKDMMLTWSM